MLPLLAAAAAAGIPHLPACRLLLLLLLPVAAAEWVVPEATPMQARLSRISSSKLNRGSRKYDDLVPIFCQLSQFRWCLLVPPLPV
jgi:hypothetical protein